MYVCMNEWMDGWMDGWMDEWIERHTQTIYGQRGRRKAVVVAKIRGYGLRIQSCVFQESCQYCESLSTLTKTLVSAGEAGRERGREGDEQREEVGGRYRKRMKKRKNGSRNQ